MKIKAATEDGSLGGSAEGRDDETESERGEP